MMADEIKPEEKQVDPVEEVKEAKVPEVKAEEPVKEVKEGEQLEEAVPVVEAPVEEAKPAEDVPAVEPVVEEATEEVPVEKETEESNKEDSTEELKEQLSVIKEVRGELVQSYKENKELKATNEKLMKEHNISKKTVESLSKELEAYKTKEATIEKTAHAKRLEQLSADFKALGQEKTVEQLSKMDKLVLDEFEMITKIALENKGAEQLDSKVIPSQAIGEKAVEPVAPKSTEHLSTKDMLKGICTVLQGQQEVDGSKGKRIINL